MVIISVLAPGEPPGASASIDEPVPLANGLWSAIMLRPALYRLMQHMRMRSGDGVVQRQILADCAALIEPLFGGPSAFVPINFWNPANGVDHLIHRMHEKSIAAWLNNFSERSGGKRN